MLKDDLVRCQPKDSTSIVEVIRHAVLRASSVKLRLVPGVCGGGGGGCGSTTNAHCYGLSHQMKVHCLQRMAENVSFFLVTKNKSELPLE